MWSNALNVLISFILSWNRIVSHGNKASFHSHNKHASLNSEGSIPIIEIRGEGKPMTSAQIRQLEEAANAGPLDTKVEKILVPSDCSKKAKRLDFVTFAYKGFTELGQKFDQSQYKFPKGIRIQLGVRMIIPGLDKTLESMCEGEIWKVQVPYRLSQRNKSKVWKNFPTDEHWIIFEIKMIKIEEWENQLQFEFMDLDKDYFLTANELVKFHEKMVEFGKDWDNQDIDTVIAARYYVRYFDINSDDKIDLDEFNTIIKRDMKGINGAETMKYTGDELLREPNLGWILDFNNDGVVSRNELDMADKTLQEEPQVTPTISRTDL